MALTKKEEDTIKLMVQKLETQFKLAQINLDMRVEIQEEFTTIDKRIRKEKEPLFLPLEATIKNIDVALKAMSE